MFCKRGNSNYVHRNFFASVVRSGPGHSRSLGGEGEIYIILYIYVHFNEKNAQNLNQVLESG